ncbi:Vacuolar protein sorting-associated protein 36, partial [Mucuna pruriens]
LGMVPRLDWRVGWVGLDPSLGCTLLQHTRSTGTDLVGMAGVDSDYPGEIQLAERLFDCSGYALKAFDICEGDVIALILWEFLRFDCSQCSRLGGSMNWPARKSLVSQIAFTGLSLTGLWTGRSQVFGDLKSLDRLVSECLWTGHSQVFGAPDNLDPLVSKVFNYLTMDRPLAGASIPNDVEPRDSPMAGNCLPSVKLTGSGRPVLEPNEIECFFLSGVDLLSEDDSSTCFPHLKSGLLILTTHRLLWLPDSAAGDGSSAGAVPLAAISHIFSHKKSLRSMFASPRVRFQVSLSPEGTVAASGSRSVVVTVVVRGKGDCDAFLTKFWENWRARAWEEAESATSSGSNALETAAPSSSGIYSSDGRVKMVGVSGILRKEQEMWESTDRSLQEAFQDLNALMSKAKEMMGLAEKMRLKLLSGSNSQTNATNDEEMGSKEEMQDWLLSVGIISPVTKESAGALYHQQLSRQLADFVKVPLERAGGIINLIDIYCLFNRARGTELISPDDLLQACCLWEKFDVPVVLRKFDSGVMVIQTKSHSDQELYLLMSPKLFRLLLRFFPVPRQSYRSGWVPQVRLGSCLLGHLGLRCYPNPVAELGKERKDREGELAELNETQKRISLEI